MACGAFFYGLAGLGNLPFFLAGKMNRVAVLWGLTAALCLILNSLLIPRFGGLGAAAAQMLTYLALSLMTLTAGRALMALPLRWGRLSLVLLLALVALAGVVSLPIPNPWLALLVHLVVALLVGLALAWLISPDVLGRLVRQFRRLRRP